MTEGTEQAAVTHPTEDGMDIELTLPEGVTQEQAEQVIHNAAASIKNGGRMPAAMRKKEKVPDALREALQAQLQHVLSKPLTPRMLMELSQTAELAHKMLIVAGEPRALRGARRRGMGLDYVGAGGGGVGDFGVVGANDEVDDLAALGGPLAPAPYGPGENFGAEALRNLVSDANKPKLPELFRSLDIAKSMRDDAHKAVKEHSDLSNEHQDALREVNRLSDWIDKLQAQIDEAVGAGVDPVNVPAGTDIDLAGLEPVPVVQQAASLPGGE